MAVHRPTIAAACLLFAGAAGAAPRFSLQKIDAGEAGTSTRAFSLNDRGEVAGDLDGGGPNSAFYWDGTGPARPLPVEFAHAVAINNLGEVAGISNGGPFVWSAAGGTRYLPLPAELTSFSPEDINDAGTVLARASFDPDGGLGRRLADGTTQTAAGLSNALWPGESMNSHGAVAGTLFNPPGDFSAVVWEPDGTVRRIPDGTGASVINDDGWVAGTFYDGAAGGLALWAPDGRRVGVPHVPGADVSSQLINGINNRRELVGYLNHTNHDDDAFYWSEADGTLDLQNLLDVSGAGWDLQLAVDINESGRILAWAFDPSGFRYGVLLTPVPEPSVAAMSLTLAGPVLLRRTRGRRR